MRNDILMFLATLIVGATGIYLMMLLWDLFIWYVAMGGVTPP